MYHALLRLRASEEECRHYSAYLSVTAIEEWLDVQLYYAMAYLRQKGRPKYLEIGR